LAWTMLSIPSRSAVPGATISNAFTSRGSWRASSSASSSTDREAIKAILAGGKVRNVGVIHARTGCRNPRADFVYRVEAPIGTDEFPRRRRSPHHIHITTTDAHTPHT